MDTLWWVFPLLEMVASYYLQASLFLLWIWCHVLPLEAIISEVSNLSTTMAKYCRHVSISFMVISLGHFPLLRCFPCWEMFMRNHYTKFCFWLELSLRTLVGIMSPLYAFETGDMAKVFLFHGFPQGFLEGTEHLLLDVLANL